MKITEKVKTIILEAEAKALGTLSTDGVLNVVPMSMVKIENDSILLFNFLWIKLMRT